MRYVELHLTLYGIAVYLFYALHRGPDILKVGL